MVASEVSGSVGAPETAAEEDSRSRRRALIALLLLFAVALIILWILFSRMIAVPDVVGLTEDDARSVLTEAGFVVGDVVPAPVEEEGTVDPGQVSSQEPSGGSRAFRGSVVDLRVLLAGGSADGDDGLQPGDGSTADGYASDTWDDSADDDGEGDEQPLVASSGPRIPLVQNMTPSAAVTELKRAGYRAVIGGYGPTTGSVPAGRVYYQNPPPDTVANRGTLVTVWISTGAPGTGATGTGTNPTWPYPSPP